MSVNPTPEDAFELYDLKVEVVAPPGARIIRATAEHAHEQAK